MGKLYEESVARLGENRLKRMINEGEVQCIEVGTATFCKFSNGILVDENRRHPNVIIKTLIEKYIAEMAKVVVAAGLIIFRRISGEVQYLMLQASYGDYHWSPPKGMINNHVLLQ